MNRGAEHLERSARLRAAFVLVSAVALLGCGSAGNKSTSSVPPPITAIARACREEYPPTAGNRVAWFMGDVLQGRDATITGGVDDPFGCAYDQLCEQIRSRVGEAEFRRSRGEAVSDALSADSWRGPTVDDDRGLKDQYPGLESLDPKLRSAWEELSLVRYARVDGRAIVTGSEPREKWRISLVREGEAWRVCGFARLAG